MDDLTRMPFYPRGLLWKTVLEDGQTDRQLFHYHGQDHQIDIVPMWTFMHEKDTVGVGDRPLGRTQGILPQGNTLESSWVSAGAMGPRDLQLPSTMGTPSHSPTEPWQCGSSPPYALEPALFCPLV